MKIFKKGSLNSEETKFSALWGAFCGLVIGILYSITDGNMYIILPMAGAVGLVGLAYRLKKKALNKSTKAEI